MTTQITYTYEILSTDTQNNTMEVVYSTEGKGDVLSILTLPTIDQTVEEVIQQYVPIYNWTQVTPTYASVNVGTTGSSEITIKPSLTKAEEAIARRNWLLADSDWTQISDVSMDNDLRNEWSVYRQALRDITAQNTFPETIQWPTIPSVN